MQTEQLLIIFVVLVVAAAFLLLWRRRDRGVDVIAPAAPEQPLATPHAAPPPVAELPPEGHGVADSAAAAAEDIAGQFLGVDAHPDHSEGPADDLTRLKGLGPKAAARLGELGVHRYAQIAAWNDDDVARFDGQLGPFKGRITRDQWVEQARHLAADDVAGFEAKFGKLGG